MAKSCWPDLDPLCQDGTCRSDPCLLSALQNSVATEECTGEKTQVSTVSNCTYFCSWELLHSLVGKSTARLQLDRPAFELQKSIFHDFPLDCPQCLVNSLLKWWGCTSHKQRGVRSILKESVRHKMLWGRWGLTSTFQSYMWGPVKNQAWFSRENPRQQKHLS